MSHLDSDALKKIIELECEYTKAMDKLERYYGDVKKIVQACMNEIKNPSYHKQLRLQGVAQFEGDH